MKNAGKMSIWGANVPRNLIVQPLKMQLQNFQDREKIQFGILHVCTSEALQKTGGTIRLFRQYSQNPEVQRVLCLR